MLRYDQALCTVTWVLFLCILSKNLFAETTPISSKLQVVESTQIETRYEELQELHNTLNFELKENKRRLQKLTAEIQLQQTALDILEAENQKLRESERNTFFIYGVCAVSLGVILTLIIPKLRLQKRYSEWG